MAQPRAQRDKRKRFYLLTGIVVVSLAMLCIRLFTLTVIQGAQLADRAEDRLDNEKLLPTWRGRILDRKGRVLAQDIASYSACVSYPLAKGAWAAEQAQAQARNLVGRSEWRKLSPQQRQEKIDLALPEWTRKQGDILEVLAARGGISRSEMNQRLAVIARRIDERAAAVHQKSIEARRARGLSDDIKPEPIREMRESHVVLRDIDSDTANELRRMCDAMPGALEVIDSSRREHPWSVAEVEVERNGFPLPIRTTVGLVMSMKDPFDLLVGSVRSEAWEEDLKRRPFEKSSPDGGVEVDLGGYRAGPESVGARGFEREFEAILRGSRGMLVKRLDTNEVERTEPIPGKDVELSIDAQLQLRIQAALDPRAGLTQVQPWHAHSKGLRSGDMLPAAAVVIDVRTGDVLAAASTPVPGQERRGSGLVIGAESASINRAISAAYPPGSLVKPLVYLAAVAQGVATEDLTVPCNGHFFKERKDVARCWIYRSEHNFDTHTQRTGGPLGIEAALARSCNIYFYTLASRIGAANLCEWYRRFGLGTLGGSVPSVDAALKLDARRDTFATVSLGIGQGSLAVTPLEIASAYAAIGRGGQVIAPSFTLGGGTVSGEIAISPSAAAKVLAGLEDVVRKSYGTGHHMDFGGGATEPIFDIAGVRVWAKTGTAEAPPLKVDREGDNVEGIVLNDADHAWCAALVAADGESVPRYSIAVLVEHGGGGGRTAGPVTAAVIRALVREGYLSGEPSRSGVRVNLGSAQ